MKTTRLREVMNDGSEPLASPISSEGGAEENDDKKASYTKRLAAIEKRLKALELRIGDLPSAPAKTAEQFARKVSGRKTESDLTESRKFAKKITTKGCK